MPYYGEENQSGHWWDGKSFRKHNDIQDVYYLLERGRIEEEKSTHVDGVFKCPCCWNLHFIVSNYDYLCDGCVRNMIHDNPSKIDKETFDAIMLWKNKEKLHFSGHQQSEILERIKERDCLEKQQREVFLLQSAANYSSDSMKLWKR